MRTAPGPVRYFLACTAATWARGTREDSVNAEARSGSGESLARSLRRSRRTGALRDDLQLHRRVNMRASPASRAPISRRRIPPPLLPGLHLVCSRRSAIVTPPPSAHDNGFRRAVDGRPLVVNQGHALHPSLQNYTYLSGSHSTAHPVSTARLAAPPFLYVAGTGAGQGTHSATTPRALPPAVPVAARHASAVVGGGSGGGSGGGGGGPCRPPWHVPRVTARPSIMVTLNFLVPLNLLAPRRSAAGVPAPSAPVVHAVPPGWVPPPPVDGSSSEPIHADEVDDREHVEGGGNWSVHPGPPNYHPRPLAASTPTLPVGSYAPALARPWARRAPP